MKELSDPYDIEQQALQRGEDLSVRHADGGEHDEHHLERNPLRHQRQQLHPPPGGMGSPRWCKGSDAVQRDAPRVHLDAVLTYFGCLSLDAQGRPKKYKMFKAARQRREQTRSSPFFAWMPPEQGGESEGDEPRFAWYRTQVAGKGGTLHSCWVACRVLGAEVGMRRDHVVQIADAGCECTAGPSAKCGHVCDLCASLDNGPDEGRGEEREEAPAQGRRPAASRAGRAPARSGPPRDRSPGYEDCCRPISSFFDGAVRRVKEPPPRKVLQPKELEAWAELFALLASQGPRERANALLNEELFMSAHVGYKSRIID